MQTSTNDSVAKFQSRRLETWRIIRPWVLVAPTAFVVFPVLFEFPNLFDELGRLILIYGSFLVTGVSIGRMALTVSKLYRCPACDSVPRGRNGVLVDPDECPKCGARLK
jgi:hypothetical protein